MHDLSAETAKGEWKAHWRVVLAGMAGISLGAIPAYATGLFIHPLEQEFGWSRAGISFGLTIYAAVGMSGAPLAGMLVDRFGSRQIGIFGVALFCTLVAMLSLVTEDIYTWWTGWLLLGIAALFTKATVWSKAVTSFFSKGRGVALAVMASGTGAATVVLPTLSHQLIEAFGWRGAFIGVGLCYGLVILPLLWFWFFDAADKPVTNDERSRAERLRAMPGWSAREGLRKRQVYQIALAALLATGVITGYSLHFVSMLSDMGLPRAQVAGMLGLVGVLAIASRVGVGFIFDHVSHPAVGTLSIALPIVPAAILLFMEPSPVMAICAIVGLGIAIGGEYDAVIYLSSRYFGLRAFGLLFGIVGSLLLAGVGLGPLLAGHIFDRFGSYDYYYMLTIPVSLLAGLLIATLGPYPNHTERAQVA